MMPLPPRAIQLLALAALTPVIANAATTQTNYGTGDGTTPGAPFDTTGNLLSTNLSTVSRSGTFYREDSGYAVDLARLSDGQLGTAGSTGLGATGNYTVMPNVAVIQFDLDGAFDLSAIRTYAMWDSGRSGQSYTVNYATAAAPSTFITLFTLTPFNQTTFPLVEDTDWDTYETIWVPDESQSSTLVQLTSDSGVLAADVVSLQFVFNGYQNGGTAYREFQVAGAKALSAVPEPASLLSTAGLLGAGLVSRRRTKDSR